MVSSMPRGWSVTFSHSVAFPFQDTVAAPHQVTFLSRAILSTWDLN